MKTMTKTLIILSLALAPLLGHAQPQQWQAPHQQREQNGKQQQRFDPQKFQQAMIASCAREACFSEAETQAFTPIYKEMKEKQWKLGMQVHELKSKRYSADKEYLGALNKIKVLQVEMAEVEADYFKKLCKIVSPEKLFKFMLAEDKYHRQMVRGSNQQRNNKQHSGVHWGRPGFNNGLGNVR